MVAINRYCPRCDRVFPNAMKMQEHLEKHPDFDPVFFGDKPEEDKTDLNEWPEQPKRNR